MNCREIAIWTEPQSRKFVGIVNGKRNIKCAFSLSDDCTPDCAACDIWGTDRKATCTRMPPNSECIPTIGIVVPLK